jgi:hypothetical protein
MPTLGEQKAAEVGALLKARIPIVWVQSLEEQRVFRAIVGAAAQKGVDYPTKRWDCCSGLTDPTGKVIDASAQDPAEVLKMIQTSSERCVYVMCDVHKWFDNTVLRRLRNLAQLLGRAKRDEARSIVILTPPMDIPPDLQDHVVMVKWELPDRAELGGVFDTLLRGVSAETRKEVEASGVRDAAIEAAVGLTVEAATNTLAKSLATQRKIVPSLVAADKKAVVKGKGLEWFEPDPRGLEAVGGLIPFKKWLSRKMAAFDQKARDYGLPMPKGVMLVGVPGCGKSLLAKAVATALQCPLLRGDFGASQSKWVGESQENIRKVFAMAEAVGRCVLWLDEIEKALGGAISGAADGGVSQDALGTFLSWMQERKGQVFVIATANDVSKLPPELLRKGRFDEMFFVDLPTLSEREEILRVTFKQFPRDVSGVNVREVAGACKDFTGSEVAAIVAEAFEEAFYDGGREITTDDLIASAVNVAPLAVTAKEKISALREWAKGRARPASTPEESTAGGSVERSLDM